MDFKRSGLGLVLVSTLLLGGSASYADSPAVGRGVGSATGGKVDLLKLNLLVTAAEFELASKLDTLIKARTALTAAQKNSKTSATVARAAAEMSSAVAAKNSNAVIVAKEVVDLAFSKVKIARDRLEIAIAASKKSPKSTKLAFAVKEAKASLLNYSQAAVDSKNAWLLLKQISEKAEVEDRSLESSGLDELEVANAAVDMAEEEVELARSALNAARSNLKEATPRR